MRFFFLLFYSYFLSLLQISLLFFLFLWSVFLMMAREEYSFGEWGKM